MTGPTRARTALAVLALLAAATGCGDTTTADTPADNAGDGPRASASSSVEPSNGVRAADGDWLLRFGTAQGADGEQSRAVLVRYNPTTGVASVRSLPRVTASDAGADDQVLLVSADHTRALPDTAVPAAQARTGKLVVYSVTDDTTETLDIRAVTGAADLEAVGWAFDPTAASVLRVVDSRLRVWKVDLDAHSATQEGQLARRSGWIFGNGFDRSTGEPYIESVDTDRTDPPGNGTSDTRPVHRQGGTLVPYDGEPLDGLPTPPCGFAGGFRFDGGQAWMFCADTPSIRAYVLNAAGTAWQAQGTPSPKVVPPAAAELSFVLPPVA